ncbi:MAG: DUF262 domain-containing protein [Candidatus Marinimicrobia bacterium]|nr:DUF262 domain-containing protein [Candidatus Neomarinimicrobiota bacterium]
MAQLFATRLISIRDFEEWNNKSEITLQPKFQRRLVWSDKARSFLIDSILRGKPIPKLYMRQDINIKSKRTAREIVDGQQRLSTVFLFLNDGFKIIKAHNKEYANMHFSDLDDDTQISFYNYEFVVDLLQMMSDKEVIDIFTRLNSYGTTLNAQELRHANFFGSFRSLVYEISQEYYTFWIETGMFTETHIMRMQEAEFVSELLIAMVEGIKSKQKLLINKFYRLYDADVPNEDKLLKHFYSILDKIGTILGSTFASSKFSSRVIFYPLFCALYHMEYGLQEFNEDRKRIKKKDHAKVQVALESINYIYEIYEKIEAIGDNLEALTDLQMLEKKTALIDQLSASEQEFYSASRVHWVNSGPRTVMTKYISKLIVEAIP